MRAALIVLCLLAPLGVGATESAPAPPSTPTPAPDAVPCSSADHRAFDFWLGEWQVFGGPAMDRVVGTNRIEKVASGCALAEHWVNARGLDGRSLNVYEASTGQWTQFWIGSDGVVLRLTGGLDGRDMLLQGTLLNGAAGEQRQRIRWTPNDDGSVVQRWETSDDSGASWQTSFVGQYRRAAD